MFAAVVSLLHQSTQLYNGDLAGEANAKVCISHLIVVR